ncbi:MAG: hypothetical protein BJ554DRAFT_1605 [Olpidium bornovanus]|uniref:Uncharacterized protein n=1 Tax=Olpidium bornovanus TaxID=278681 RepID=A0A8H8DGY5_9FUNG|nr:MAG: hypothetical protein BJ554DRAFT_1605 [Olpidium bornovanus]
MTISAASITPPRMANLTDLTLARSPAQPNQQDGRQWRVLFQLCDWRVDVGPPVRRALQVAR